MSKGPTVLLLCLLAGILAVTAAACGRIGSTVMTPSLLLGLGLIALQQFLESRDPDDFHRDK